MTRMCCRFIRPRATNGRVKIEVYPNSTLRQDMEEMEALHLGAVQNDRESRIGKAAIDAVNSESAALGAR